MELPSPQELEEQAKNEALSTSITHNRENEKNSVPTAAAVATGTTAAAATPSASFLPSLWPSKNSSTPHPINNDRVISTSSNAPPPSASSSSASAAPLEGNSPNRKQHGGGPLDPWIQKAIMAFRSNPNTTKEDSAMGNRHDPLLWLRMKQKQAGTSKVDSTVIRNDPEKDEMADTMFASGIGGSGGGGDGSSSSSNSSSMNNNAVETSEPPMIDLLTNSMDVDEDSIPVRGQVDVVLAPTGNVSIVMDDAHWINGNGMSSTELNQQDAIDISRENETCSMEPIAVVDSRKVGLSFGHDIRGSHDGKMVGSNAKNDAKDVVELSTNNADIGHGNSKDEDVFVGVETLYGSTIQDPVAVGSTRVDDEDMSLSRDDVGATTNVVEASSKDNSDIAREEISPLSEQVELPPGSSCQDPIVNMKKAEDGHVIGILSKDIIGVHNVGDELTDTAQDENNHSLQGVVATFNCKTSGQDQTADSVQVHDNLVGLSESGKGANDEVDECAENGDKAREEMSHASEDIEISSGSISQDPLVGMTKVDDDGNDVKEKDNHHVSDGGEISHALQCQAPIVDMNKVDNDDVVGVSKDDVPAMDVAEVSKDNVVENNINHDSEGGTSSDSQCQDPTVVLTKEDDETVGLSKDDVVANNDISYGGETSHDLQGQDPIVDMTKADGHMVGTSKDDVVAADGVDMSENNDISNIDSISGREKTSDVPHCQDPIADVTKADDGDMVGTSKDDVVAADGVNMSENNDIINIDSISGREKISDVSHCQDPIADVTKADDGDMVDTSKDDAVAADRFERPKGNVSDCDNLVSGGGEASRDAKCQDPIVDVTIADDGDMVGISKDDVDATDVSKDNVSENDVISTRRIEASHDLQCQDPIMDMTKADDGHMIGTSKDDAVAAFVVGVSENNDISNDDLVAGGGEASRDTKCQDPIAGVTKADDGDMVGISKDDVDATDKIDVSEIVNGDDNDVSGEGEISHDLQCQDPIVNMANADDGHMVGTVKDDVDTTDKVDVSKDNISENDIISTRRIEASHSSTCQDYVVGSTKASNENDDKSVEHGESIKKISSDDDICNIGASVAEANKVANDYTRFVEKSRDSLEVSNTKETEVVDTKSNAQDVSLVDSGARDIPSSDRKHSLRNRFVNWRSKADAVLQNNQVFQLAQKNIEETNKKLQQVVENRNIGSLGARTSGYFRSPMKNTNTETNEWHKNEIDEKIAHIGSLDDDLSFDSTGGKSSISEDSSEGSSVFADSSDEESYSSSLSETSSVYANGISTRRIRGNNLLRQRSFSSRPESVSVVAAMSSTDAGEEIAKNEIGVTPTKSNITGRSSANGTTRRSVDGSVSADVSPSIVSPITSYKGRYEPSTLRGINRNHVLQQIQGKVRSPSPVHHFSSTKATNDETEQKFESQTSLLLKSIPASKMKELAETLSPGQYLMVLRPGMLGVNLKQTFLPGYGVYVDHILPGGNAEKSGVVCIGDSVVKVGNVDVSKGTIYDVPGIIAGAKRPAIIILNGEYEIGVEDMDYLTVAFGLVNKIVDEATLGVSKSPTPDIPMGTEPWFSIVSDLPPETLRIEVQNWSKRRNNSKAAFSIIKAAFKQDQNLQKILKKAFRICCLDNRRLPFFASFLTNDDAFNAAGDRTDLVSASTSLMLYLEIVSFQSLYTFASRKRITDHARLIAHKFLLRNESNEPLFNLRSLFPEDLIKDLQENLNLKLEEIDRSLFNNIETYLENSLVGTKFASFLLSDECARMRAYMRGTVSYIDPPLELLINNINLTSSEANVSACNVLRFMLVYLLCQKENDALDKNFDNKIGISSKEAKRSIGSAGGLSCSIFLLRTLQPLLSEASKTLEHQGEEGNTNIIFKFICALEDFWDFFVAPRGGVLDASTYSNETNDLIEQIREALVTSVESCHITDTEKKLMAIVRSLLQDGHFSENLSKLRNDLLYDYHINHHSKYKAHIFHEFMCAEASETSENKLFEGIKDNNGVAFALSLRTGSISRLFRKVDIPKGVSQHRPAHATIDYTEIENQHEHAKCNMNADFAVVFSARSHAVESDTNTIGTNNDFSVFDRLGFRRTVTASISGYGKTLSEKMPLDQIFPVTMISYAMIPPLKDRAFKDSVDFGRRIKQNWEVSLVNFMAPNANISFKDQPNQFLYGVTLVMNEVDNSKEAKKAMAISLVAERNVIPAMRSSLMKLYEDKVLSAPNDNDCSSFVSSLEKLEAESDSSASLSVLLEPYLKMGSSPWVDQPLTNQAKNFERSSLEFLVESLTPVPLSLLFVTALLEQKIVFTSQRRSSLVSLIVGLRSLLSPMSWSHLIVPTVPPSLAADLVQYPAPFIIGIPLDSKESMDLLKVLPDDITLVDVDAGRVILTKRFLHHSEVSNTKNNDQLNSVALRSQVLHLAESLGHVFGVYQSDSVWRCDSPLTDSIVHVESLRKVEATQKVARSFIHELTAGLNTCCYWIEEEVHQKDIKAEQNILFDEDRFLHLKELRYQDQYFSLFESKDLEIAGHNSSIKQAPILALRMADFHLVIETFLRGQMISSFVSSQDKRTMPFW